MQKLYFYKCTHFLLFLSLSTVRIHQFHSYTNILTLIPLIPTLIPRIPNLISCIPTPIPCIPTMILRIPTLIPRIPSPVSSIPTLIPHIAIIPTLISHIPIILLIPFPDSPFWLLQRASLLETVFSVIVIRTFLIRHVNKLSLHNTSF